ncbi:MAG TPA: nuclear transport factor 2 family protein [Rhizomicrobium sp.]
MTVTHEEAVKLAEAYTAAWNTGSSEAVAAFFAPQGRIVINGGEPWTGHAGVQKMAEGFFAEVPDLSLVCDHVRSAGDHVVYVWTFRGTHADTKNDLHIVGWEEWDIDAKHKIVSSRGWFDAEDYARQVAG